MASGGGRIVKTLFVIVAAMGFISFLLTGVFESEESERRGSASLRHVKVVTREDKVNSTVKSCYMTKRRVPNGSDPIHNRKAGNSGRPPKQA